MAVFCNQATISFGGVVRQSNIACGEIVETVRMTKTALIGTYDAGSVMTYIVNVTNDGETPLSNVTFTDDLGQYDMGQASYTPRTYVDGSLKVFADGEEMPAPAVTADPGLTAEGIDVPAGGSVTLIYAARVNEFAPLGEDEEGNAETIVNSDGTESFLPNANIFAAALIVLVPLALGLCIAHRRRGRAA